MGGKSKKSVTVGYRYYLGLHFGMCHGPVDTIEEIQVGDRVAWSGNQTASGQIYVNSPELFGGESKEGGIQGSLDVMMGEPAQATNSYLASKQGTPQPAYRGILGLVYRGGLIACNNPYVKPWATRVRRVLKGWHNDAVWYSAKASINVGSNVIAANPAHIVYECLTNPSWGMGYPTNLIDNASFQAAADAFYSEGLGLCIMWARQDSLDNFIQLVLDHAGAVLSQDSGGGFFKLKALRGDYVPGNLELFDDQNGKIVTLEKIERTTYTENVNELAIQYVDATTGRNASIFVQNLSNVQAQGSVVSQTRQYPGIPNANLAARIGMRDLKATTSGLARITFVANRAAFYLVPGDVIRFAWQPAGIASMSLRVTRIDYGPLTSGLIRIEGIEDVFGLPATVYADAPPIGWTPPNYTPQPASSTMAMEATYKDVYDILGANDIGTLAATEGYIEAVATRPSNSMSFNYQLQTRAGSAAYTDRGYGDWAPTGTLVNGISKTATSIVLQSELDLDMIQLNTLAVLGSGSSVEIVQVTAVDLSTLTLTIKRGCVDTVPKVWPSGTRFTSYDLHASTDEIEYVSGETVSARFITKSSTGTLATGSAPVATVTLNQRAARPYPPGQVRFNSQVWPAEVRDSVIVSWAHRDRVLQADQILDQEASGVGPEAGTTYRVRGFNASTNASLFDATVSGTTYTYIPITSLALRVDLRSIRGGLDSFQMHEHELTCIVEATSTLARTTQRATSQIAVSVPSTSQWTPDVILTQIANWFDAGADATIIEQANVVSEWRDRSGNNRHAVMDTLSARPTWAQSSLNNKPSITFSNDALWAPMPTLSGLCLFLVFQRSSSGTIFQMRKVGNEVVIDDNATGGFGTRLRNSAGTIASGPNYTVDTVPHVAAFTFTSGTLELFLDGTSRSTRTVSGSYPMERLSLGGNGIDVTTQAYGGKISEAIVTNTLPDQATRERIEGYLAWKWGTVSLLPTAHPYKSAPPT
jgi:hypothetical protein